MEGIYEVVESMEDLICKRRDHLCGQQKDFGHPSADITRIGAFAITFAVSGPIQARLIRTFNPDAC